MGLDIYFEKRQTTVLKSFRKINFLVKFFEDKGMDVENQIPIRISRANIKELINLCTEVLADESKAETLLPTCSGFFFGSTDYDEDYFENIKEVLWYCKEELLPEFDSLNSDEELYFSIWY